MFLSSSVCSASSVEFRNSDPPLNYLHMGPQLGRNPGLGNCLLPTGGLTQGREINPPPPQNSPLTDAGK